MKFPIIIQFLWCRPTATVIVRHGTLTKGDILVAGQTWIKVRAMLNEQMKAVKSAPPSTPVVTVGWRELPSAGDKYLQVS
jgi:translation initiation factor IF-2